MKTYYPKSLVLFDLVTELQVHLGAKQYLMVHLLGKNPIITASKSCDEREAF